MMKSKIFIFAFLLCASIAFASINTSQSGEFKGRCSFAFRNLTIAVIDSGNQKCVYNFTETRESYGRIVCTLNFTIGLQKHIVTNENVGNNELRVDERIYKFDSAKYHLLFSADGNISQETGEIHPMHPVQILNSANAIN